MPGQAKAQFSCWEIGKEEILLNSNKTLVLVHGLLKMARWRIDATMCCLAFLMQRNSM